MSTELRDQIRDLIETGARPIELDEITQATSRARRSPTRRRSVTGRRSATGRRGLRAFRPQLVTAAVVAVGCVVALTVSQTGQPASRSGSQPGSHPGPAAALTAQSVLHQAELAAFSLPATATPKPSQFVYTKEYLKQNNMKGISQNWVSVDGKRIGRQEFPGMQGTNPACVNGYWQFGPGDWNRQHCTVFEAAAFEPGMPTNPAALRPYLIKHYTSVPYSPDQLLLTIGQVLMTVYLTPAQLAAVLHVLAQTPGLTVVPKATDVTGRTGVGIRAPAFGGDSIDTFIFNPKTYTVLGVNEVGVASHMKGSFEYQALLRTAIVNHPGQQP
jgi:hypothetical protein